MSQWRKTLPLLFGMLTACTTNDMATPVEPGYKPKQTSTEAGLWMQMDRFEKRLANSELVERDAELNQYVRGVLCRIAPDHCNDIRLFILKNPHFNASMAPNGSMHVWTGLLLRVQNEDQLASVLGHEMAHYVDRHGLQQWNTTKSTMEFLTFFTIATGGFGFVAMIGAAGGLQAYSQEFEYDADEKGLTYSHDAGYDVTQTIKLWELVKAEKEASKDENTTSSSIWASHPPTADRIEKLKELASNLPSDNQSSATSDTSEFEHIYNKYWHEWAENLVSVATPKEAVVVFERLKENGRNTHEVAFFQGEVFRRKGSDETLVEAMKYYEIAAKSDPAPLKTYKSMGLIAKRQNQPDKAKQFFEKYLKQNPEASDRSLVQVYMKQLEQ